MLFTYDLGVLWALLCLGEHRDGLHVLDVDSHEVGGRDLCLMRSSCCC